MRHRRSDKDCPLCPLWGVEWDPDVPSTHGMQHAHAERLWRAWNGGRGGAWKVNVSVVARELGVACTIEQARKHFHYHRVEQPALSGQLNRERLLYEAGFLPARAQAVLTAVYRQRVLTTEQLCEVFYAPHYNGRSALSKCQQELIALAARHFLYRLYPDERMAAKKDAPKNFGKQALWLLGKAALPFVESRYGVKVWREHYAQMAKDVSDVRLMHDLRATGIYVRLARAMRERQGLIVLPDHGLSAAELKPDNWYGDKSLALSFYDTAARIEDEVRADGFATVSVHRSSWAVPGEGLPSCQMPFFYEYDRGSKDMGDVVQQLLAYHLLARARKAAERFPDLNAEDYAVPVLMVFSTRARMESAHRRFLKLAAAERLPTGGAPILLVAESDWLEDPLAEGICRLAWDERERGVSFLDLLLRASAPLIASRTVLASRVLTIDLKAARRLTGATSASGLEDQRAKQAKRRRLDEEERLREARLETLRGRTDAEGNPLALPSAKRT